jgi:hypothetical protein
MEYLAKNDRNLVVGIKRTQERLKRTERLDVGTNGALKLTLLKRINI